MRDTPTDSTSIRAKLQRTRTHKSTAIMATNGKGIAYTFDVKDSKVVEEAPTATLPSNLKERMDTLKKERPTLEEINSTMLKAEKKRGELLQNKVNKLHESTVHGATVRETKKEYAENISLLPAGAPVAIPERLAKRAEELRAKGFKSPQELAQQMEVASKNREKVLSLRRTKAAEAAAHATEVRDVKNKFSENFEIFGQPSKTTSVPARLENRAKALKKEKRTAAQIQEKVESAVERREEILSKRQATARATAGTPAKKKQKDKTDVDLSTNDGEGALKFDHIEVFNDQSQTAAVTLPPHLQQRADALAKARETAEQLESRLKSRDEARQALLDQRVSQIKGHHEHADEVRKNKKVLATNIELLPTRQTEAPALPVKLAKRAETLKKEMPSMEALNKKRQEAEKNRKAVLQDKVIKAQHASKKGEEVRRVKNNYGENMSFLGNGQNAAKLPTKLAERAMTLKRDRKDLGVFFLDSILFSFLDQFFFPLVSSLFLFIVWLDRSNVSALMTYECPRSSSPSSVLLTLYHFTRLPLRFLYDRGN